MTTKNQTQVKKITGMDNIPYITSGVASESEGYIISEDGLTALVESSFTAEANAAANTQLQTQVNNLTQQLTAANAAKKTAEDALTAANNTIAAKDTEIEGLNEQLNAASGFTEKPRKTDPVGKGKKVAAHLDANNVINAMADRLLGAPGAKKIEEEEEE